MNSEEVKKLYEIIENIKIKSKCLKVLILCNLKTEQELNEIFANSSDCKIICTDGLYSFQYDECEQDNIFVIPDYDDDYFMKCVENYLAE